jgi:STE24 endopeptidase
LNGYLIFILAVMLADFALGLIVRALNARAATPQVPPEFADVYDAERYARAQDYLQVNSRFATVADLISTPLMVGFLMLGGFGWVDGLIADLGFGPIGTGLLFCGLLALASSLLGLPFSIYRTFVIEERFGFNKTTRKTFILDRVKGLVLGGLIGGGLLALVIWLFSTWGPSAWWVVWASVSGVQLGLAFLSPTLLIPLFLKFDPMEEGELRTAIEAYAKAQSFAAQGVYQVDGSRRSTKANAFFAGFGAKRRIALFDTLIERHPPAEIVAVLAHEIGHAKHRHVLQSTCISLMTTGLTIFLFSLFIGNADLQAALGATRPSIHVGLIAFALLFEPLSMLLGIAGAAWSRHNERQADAFAARTTGDPQALAASLKRLSADALGNLTPHPLKVLLSYSHPPVLERVRSLLGHRPGT